MFGLVFHFQVYGWGRGEHGRLGFGDSDKSSKMLPQRVQLLAGEDIVQVLSLQLSMINF
jgi:alpha-tubulin suppressor-like RCC1 family protein